MRAFGATAAASFTWKSLKALKGRCSYACPPSPCAHFVPRPVPYSAMRAMSQGFRHIDARTRCTLLLMAVWRRREWVVL